MLERDIEAHLVKRCKEIGALCEKFTSPQRRSVPDRIVSFNSHVWFIELKAPGKKPSEAQARDHEKRRMQGLPVFVFDSITLVDSFIKLIA